MCFAHELSSAVCYPARTSCRLWAVQVLAGTCGGGGRGGLVGAGGTLQEEVGLEVCRKLLLSGSWGFVVLTHWAHSKWTVLLHRPLQ